MYAVIFIAYEEHLQDTFVDVLAADIKDIKKAEKTRSFFIEKYNTENPQNIQVIHYEP